MVAALSVVAVQARIKTAREAGVSASRKFYV
jgi:hypothetical protein